MHGQCHKKLYVNGFKWVKDISQFDESFIKSYNEENDEGYFLEVDIQYPENLQKPKTICLIYLKE